MGALEEYGQWWKPNNPSSSDRYLDSTTWYPPLERFMIVSGEIVGAGLLMSLLVSLINNLASGRLIAFSSVVWRIEFVLLIPYGVLFVVTIVAAFIGEELGEQENEVRSQLSSYNRSPITLKEVAMSYAASRLGLCAGECLERSKLDWRLRAEKISDLHLRDKFSTLRERWEQSPLGEAIRAAARSVDDLRRDRKVVTCRACGGAGRCTDHRTLIRCPSCRGRGVRLFPGFGRDLQPDPEMDFYRTCGGCEGTGFVHPYYTCAACGGTGTHSEPSDAEVQSKARSHFESLGRKYDQNGRLIAR